MSGEGLERRRRALTEEDVCALVDAMAARQPASLGAEMHAEHHAFLESWIAKEKRRTEMWGKVQTQVFGWGIIGVCGGIGVAVWDWVRTHMR